MMNFIHIKSSWRRSIGFSTCGLQLFLEKRFVSKSTRLLSVLINTEKLIIQFISRSSNEKEGIPRTQPEHAVCVDIWHRGCRNNFPRIKIPWGTCWSIDAFSISSSKTKSRCPKSQILWWAKRGTVCIWKFNFHKLFERERSELRLLKIELP